MKTLILLFFYTILSFAHDRVILTTHHLSPYGFYDQHNNFTGIAVSPVQYAMEQMNQAYEIRVIPWKRAQVLVQQGKADGFFAASKNKKRDSYAIMSTTIADQKWNWYWLKESNLDPDSKQFRTKTKVSSFYGANMQSWLKENGYNVAASPHNTEHAVKLLLSKRFEALLANNYVMKKIIEEQNLYNRFHIQTAKSKPLGVYFSKEFLQKHPNFLKNFNYYILEYKIKNNLRY